MRSSYSQQNKGISANRLMHADLHRFVETEGNKSTYELATEFGLSIREVKALKRRMGRN